MAQLTPATIWNGKTQVHIEFVQIGEPKAIDKGKWQVSLVSNLIIRSPQNPSGHAISFNKVFFVRAVDTPPLPLPDEATPLQQAAHQIRLSQLEIYKIVDLKEKK